MKSFENRRAQIDAYKRNKKNTKSLEINDKTTSSNDIVSFEVKGKGEGKEDTSSPIPSSSPIAGEEEQAGNATSQADKTKDTYRFEQYNPDTGERPYCGIPIPHDAPPKPNDQAT